MDVYVTRVRSLSRDDGGGGWGWVAVVGGERWGVWGVWEGCGFGDKGDRGDGGWWGGGGGGAITVFHSAGVLYLCFVVLQLVVQRLVASMCECR